MDAPLDADGNHGNDVGMVQLRGRLGLVLEAGDLPAVEDRGERQDLQGDASRQRNLLRLVDDAHAAAADLPPQAKVAKPPGFRRRGGRLPLDAAGGAIEARRHVVQFVEAVEIGPQRPRQVGVQFQQLLPGRRQPSLQDGKIAVEDVRQTLLLLGRQAADGGGLNAQIQVA